MKQKILSLFFLLNLAKPAFSQLLDTIEFYSYIDTNKMNKCIAQLNIPEKEKNWLRSYYLFNYYAARKDFPPLHNLFINLKKDNDYINKYSEKWLFVKCWYFSISNQRDSLFKLYKQIINSQNYSNKLKVNILNILSYYFSNYNLITSSMCLNLAIMIGLKDSLPELYRSFLNLSGIYFSYNFTEEAMKIIERGKKFKKGNLNTILDYLYIHNEAIYHYSKENFDKAIPLYWKTYHFFKVQQIPEYTAGAIINLVRLYFYKNNIDSSFNLLHANQLFFKQYEHRLSPNFLLRYYWTTSDVYYKNNNIDSAEKYILKALNIAEKYQTFEALSDLYYDYATILKVKNNPNAYLVLDKAFSYKNQLALGTFIKFTTENTHKIKLLENNLKLNEYERNIIQAKLKYQHLQNRNRFIITIIVFLVILSFLYIRILYLRRINKLKLQHSKEMLQQHENTLHYISNELHDNIATSLNLFNQKLNNQEYKIELQKIINEIRELSHLSYPSYLFQLPFQDIIESMLHKIETTTPHTVIKQIHSPINNLPNEVKIHIYRILQELLNNTLKYNNKTTIKIEISHDNKNLILKYEDFDFQQKHKKITKGFGLNSIEHRCMLIGAKCKYHYNFGFKFKLKTQIR